MEFPTEWTTAPFSELAFLQRGKFSARPRNDPKFYGGETPFVQTGDVRAAHVTLKNFSQTLNEKGVAVSKVFPRGTLLFTIAANIGDVAFLGMDAACPDSLVAVTPRQHVDGRWLLYQIEAYQALFESAATQNAQLNINLDKLNPFQLPCPPLAEQQAIAEALSDADGVIEGLERLIAKKRRIEQGAMQDLLTAKRRLPGFSGEWVEQRIGSIAKITTGSKDTQDREANGLYPFFVRSQTVERINSVGFDGVGILTAGDGVGTGKIFHYIDGKCDFHQRVYLLHAFDPEVSARYFFHFFSNFFFDRIMSMTAKSSVDSVRREMISEMNIRLPNRLEEQEAIAKALDDIDAEITALETRLKKARQIKEGMMQNLLTGRIRLV